MTTQAPAGSASRRSSWWRLVLGTTALLLFAPGGLGLVPFSLAALLVAAEGTAHRLRGRAIAAVAAGIGFATILWPAPSSAAYPLDTVLGVYSLFAAVAFAGGALLAPAGVLRQAFRAMCWAILGVGLLGLLVRGSGFWSELHWSALRETSSTLRVLVALRPEAFTVFEPVVRIMSRSYPALVVLHTFAGLALGWQWHVRLARAPLGPPLGSFRDFRFGDQWVWGLVLAFLVWAVPKLAVLKAAAWNLGLVLGALYLLRGAAIIVTLAGVAGLPAWVLVAAGVVMSLLVLPLLIVVPGLWTIGVFDTWLAFRQRRIGRPTVQ